MSPSQIRREEARRKNITLTNLTKFVEEPEERKCTDKTKASEEIEDMF